MIIDASTSIVIAFSVILTAFVEVLHIYMDRTRTDKKKHYFIVFFAAVVALFAIFILHNWDVTKLFVENLVSSVGFAFERSISGIISSIESVSSHLKFEAISSDLQVENIPASDNIDSILFAICYLLPWIPLYYTIIRASNRYHTFTIPEIILSLFILPTLVVSLEVICSMWLLTLLRSLNAAIHIIWVAIINMCLNISMVRHIIK